MDADSFDRRWAEIEERMLKSITRSIIIANVWSILLAATFGMLAGLLTLPA